MPVAREFQPSLERLLACGRGAPSLEEKLQLLGQLRELSPETCKELDRQLLGALQRTVQALEHARSLHQEMRKLVETVTAPPWFPAVLLQDQDTPHGRRLKVLAGGGARWVAVAPDADLSDAGPGAEVFLGPQQNVALGVNPAGSPRHGETATFVRQDDKQVVLSSRDEELYVDAAASLKLAELKPGSRVRWDRAAWLAYEKTADADQYLVGEIPTVGPECVGGQDGNMRQMLDALTAILIDPELASQYGLGGRNSILMVGPAGCGKTLMARVAAAEVARRTGKPCRFFVVKPGEWESMWVGQTAVRIAETFATLREAAQRDGLAILFLDEIESIGFHRGSALGNHDDKALAALLAELDGFHGRDGVAILAASNRKDLIDASLLERLSDIEIHVRRPDLRGAKAILGIHLPPEFPYSPNGTQASDTRRAMIDTAAELIYSPNSPYAGLCQIRFRDGKARSVSGRELISGRVYEQVCRATRRAAFVREKRTGERGIQVLDLVTAVHDAMTRLASTLTIKNVHHYLTDLPTDLDVVAIERPATPRRTATPPSRQLDPISRAARRIKFVPEHPTRDDSAGVQRPRRGRVQALRGRH